MDLRWIAGIAATAVLSGFGYALTAAREVDQAILVLRRDMADLQRRVEKIDVDLSTNRMTRMAPETRTELDAIRRELDSAWRRIQMLEDQMGRTK